MIDSVLESSKYNSPSSQEFKVSETISSTSFLEISELLKNLDMRII